MNLKNIVSYLLEKATYHQVISMAGLYFAMDKVSSIETYQVEKFNEIWADAIANIPFYTEWRKKHNLPAKISSLKELMAWPVLTKLELTEDPEKMYRNYPPDGHTITSGSTGIPLKIPVENGTSIQSNMWIGRSANGIVPGMRTFLIWGHHHLHGTGLRRIDHKIMREIKDRILSYKRISAYDTSAKAMQKAYKTYQRFKPQFVIGYSSSILSFVRSNKTKEINHIPKSVLCTAGPLSEKEKDEIRAYFHAPICMEYGSMECGVMAYSINDVSHYKVLWNTHLLQGLVDENNKTRNIVTLLTKKYFPLIRYDIGDWLELPKGESLSNILTIKNIIGRPTDIVTLPNGTSFFPMLIEACVEHLDQIIAHQLIVEGTNLTINIVGGKRYDKAEINSVRSNLYAIIPDLTNTNVQINQVDELTKVKSGKTPLVIRKSNH